MPTGLVKSTTQAPCAHPGRGLLGDLEDQGYGPKGLGQPARPGGLLAQAAEAHRECLVNVPRRLAPHPQLDDHEVGTVQGPVPIVGRDQLSHPTPAVQHAPGQITDDLHSFEIRSRSTSWSTTNRSSWSQRLSTSSGV